MKLSRLPCSLCCALVMLIATVPAAAQQVADSLRSHTVRADISGLVATTTVEQVWAYYGEGEAQATFQFRLPAAAVVTDLALWVNGQRCAGEIHPRNAARAIYRQIVERKRDPALMEYVGDGVWQLQVFPIAAKSSVKVDFSYTQLLTPQDGWLVYDSLAVTGEGELPKTGEFSFQATIRAPGGVADLKSATHKLGVQRLADGAMVAGVRQEDANLALPLQLAFKPGKPLPTTIILGDGGRSVFVGSLKAPKELTLLPARKLNAILVLDASLSMAAALTDARAGIMAALDQLGEGDTFNIVVVSSDATLWRPRPQPADARNKQDALLYIGQVTAGGGTDLPAGLRAAATQASDANERYELMVFTDGQDTVAAAVSQACPATMPASHPATNPAANPPPANCRIFGLCPGPGGGLETLAAWTGGAVVDNFMPQTVVEIVKAARRPSVSDAHCTAANAKDLGLRNLVLGELTAGQCLVAGEFDKDGPAEFIVTAKIDGNAVETRQTLSLVRGPDATGWVDARGWGLWVFLDAQQKLRDIAAGKAPAGDLLAIINASRKHHVLTPATSLLVLENDQAYIDRGIDRQAAMIEANQTLTIAQHRLAGVGIDGSKPATLPQDIRNTLDRAMELIQLREYDKADQLLSRAAKEHPQRFEIIRLAAAVTEIVHMAQTARSEQTLAQQRLDAFADTPWYDAVCAAVPELPQPTEQRPLADANASTQPTEPAIDAAIAAKLAAHLPRVEATNLELQNVLKWYTESTGLKLKVDWELLRDYDISPQTRVSIHLKDVAASAVLSLIARDLSKDQTVGYMVDKGTVVVSTESRWHKMTRVYDCRDLVPAVSRIRQYHSSSSSLFGDSVTTGSSGPSRPGPTGIPGPTEGSGERASRILDVRDLIFTTSALNTSSPAAYGRTDVRSTASIFGNNSVNDDAPYSIRSLVNLVTDAVDPGHWGEESPELASIHSLGTQLIVSQSHSSQAEVADLLAKIRAAKKSLDLIEYEAALRKKLQAPLNADLKGMTAAEAFQWFASAANVNLHVSWQYIKDHLGEDPRAVNIQESFPSAEAALEAIIHQAWPKGIPITFTFYQGVVLVSTPEKLSDIYDTAVYNLNLIFGENIAYQANLAELKSAIFNAVDPGRWGMGFLEKATLRDIAGLLVVRQTPRNIIAIETLLKQMARMKPDLPKLEQAFLPSGCAESLFTADGRLSAWAYDLATRAKEGKLSPWSSVKRREAMGHKFVYVGGYWIEESVTDQMKIIGVAPGSPAAGRLATAVKDLDTCLSAFECVILAAGPAAIGDDAYGLSKADDPEVIKLLEQIKK